MQQCLDILFDIGTMHITSISPVISRAFFSDQTQFRIVGPTASLGQTSTHYFGLHVNQQSFGLTLLGEILLEQRLVGGRGFESFLVHEAVERTANLVAALSDLNQRHSHYKLHSTQIQYQKGIHS